MLRERTANGLISPNDALATRGLELLRDEAISHSMNFTCLVSVGNRIGT